MEGEQPDESPWQLFKIEGVIFKSDQPLPTISRQLASEIEATKTLEFGPGWDTELDGRVRDVWQHRGYFKIGQLEDGDIEVENLKDPEDTDQEIPVRFIIKINPGKQYQFGNISFLHNTQFDSVQLRAFFSIQQGEMVDTRKIDEGIEAARTAYHERGFMEFTAWPDSVVDEDQGNVAFVINIHDS